MKKLLLMFMACFVAIAANAASSQLYLIGEPAGGWVPNVGTLLTSTEPGVFTCSFSLTKTSYFAFADQLGSSSSDWTGLNSHRYGPTSSNQQPTAEGVSMVYGKDASWMLPAGDYNLIIDTNNLILKLKGDVEYTIEGLYILGEMNSWTANDNYKFETSDNVTFTKTFATFPGSNNFKVGTSDWYISLSSSNTAMTTGTYQLETTGEDGNMAFSGDLSNVTIQVVLDKSLNTGTMTVTAENVSAIQNFYLRGLNNDWDNNSVAMNLVSEELTENGEYTYSAVVESIPQGTEFKITQNATGWDGLNFGVTGDAESPNIECGYTVELSNGSARNIYVNADLNNVTLYLYFNPDTGKSSWVKAECEAAEVTYPETVYLMGNVNGGSFAPNYGLAAEGEEGVYNWTEVKIGEGEEFGYINFATVLGTDGQDWDTTGPNSGNRYGAPAENTPVTDGTPAEVKLYAVNVSASGCQSWEVAAGTYDIELDLEDMTVTFTAVEEEIPMVPVQATFRFNSYNGMQECYPELTPTKEWEDVTGSGSSLRFYIPEDAVLKVGPATITCSKGSGTINPYFYNWSNKANYDLRTGSKNVITISMPEGYVINQIVFTAGVTSSDYLKLEATSGVLQGLTTSRKTWTPTARDAANSVTFNTTGTCAIATISVSADVPTGIEDVEMDSEAAPVFYNLQGVKVSNPEKGLYIKVVNGNASKVML